MKYYKNSKVEIKDDKSVVTQADTEIEDFLTKKLENENEGIFILGEETIFTKDDNYIKNALKNTCYIIDPIDGTSPFSKGLPMWGISIAYSKNGVIEQGCVFFPVLDEIYITEGDRLFFCHNKNWDFNNLSEVKKNQDPFNDHSIIVSTQQRIKNDVYSMKNPMHLVGSCVYSLCNVFSGSYHCYRGKFKIWDWAACLVMGKKIGVLFEFENLKEEITLEISDDIYHVSENDKKLKWKLRDNIIASNSKEAILSLKK